MNRKKGNCKNCTRINIYLANVHYELCDKCNKERLGPNKTQINEKEQKAALYAIYENKKQNEELVCSGCGSKNQLTHSHLVPISKNKKLEIEPRNIKYHCLTCHPKWESNILNEMGQLDDFFDNMRIIKEIDYKHFIFLLVKLDLDETAFS